MLSMQRVSVLLAEGSRVLREALRHVVADQRDMRVVGTVGNGGDALEEAERLSPRTVLLGILLPDVDGIEAARRMTQASSAPGVVILSPHASAPIVRRALDAGALGYVTHDGPLQEVMKALRAAAAGRRYLGESVAAGFIEVPRGASHAERHVESLTPAERNILKLVAEGRTNPEVAGVMGLSPRTVETYRIRMMRKLGLDSFAGLMKYAIRHGLATLD
jgi:DNA-binding NarL/FixJ family response regulator